MNRCSVEGCDVLAIARGYCKPHWSRWRRHGSATAVTLPRKGRLLRKGPIWQERVDPELRFWLKVYQCGDCWEWRGNRDKEGYGTFEWRRKTVRAHRLAYELVKGPIPGSLPLDHLCGHTWCVNPYHLEAVDQRTNVLRGHTLAATNARKTECLRGHPFDAENTLINDGSRVCRTCARERARERRRQCA